MANDVCTAAAALRRFLEDLTHGKRISRLPETLRRLGRRVARRMGLPGGEATSDDLVAELLARLVVRGGARRGRVGCEDLLALDDVALVGSMCHRLRQIGCEASPRWRLVRALRSHVRCALEDGLPAEAMELPDGLHRSGRLSKERVASAVSWLVEHERVPRSITPLTRRLLTRYLPEPREERDVDELPTATRAADHGLAREADAFRERLKALLSAAELALLLHRRAGRGLAELAARQCVAVSTVHARVELATARLRAVVLETGETPETVTLALEALEAEQIAS